VAQGRSGLSVTHVGTTILEKLLISDGCSERPWSFQKMPEKSSYAKSGRSTVETTSSYYITI
jgi:LPS sulfotransferase NodH